MREVKAKKLRKMVYGDNSIRVRTYDRVTAKWNATVVCTGLRSIYQGIKRKTLLDDSHLAFINK